MRNSAMQFRGLWMLLGILLVTAAYWSGLYGGFFFDDAPNILNNQGLRLDDFSGESLWRVLKSGISGVVGRPLSQLSFALNYHFSGFDPFAFKLTNLVLHGLNGILVYLLALQLLQSVRQQTTVKNIELSAALVAFVWMIHPIQVTSVLYVVQRMASLSAFFLLAALVLHIWCRRRGDSAWMTVGGFLLAWLIFWPLSMLSKETGVLLPAFVAAYELIVRRCERDGLDFVGRTVLCLSWASIAGVLLYVVSPQGQWLVSGYENRSFSLSERLLTEARVLWEYLNLITIPTLSGMALFHDDIKVSTGLVEPWTTLPAVLGIFGLAIAAVLARRRAPLLTFGIAWFFVGHSLESSFIPLELAHEHRNYVPLFGLCIMPAGLVSSLDSLPSLKRTLALAALGALVAYFGFVTALRTNMFGNEQIRTLLEAEFHPGSARANYEAGRTLASSFDKDHMTPIAASMAKKHFDLATELDENYKMGLLGQLFLSCGNYGKADQEALSELQHRFRERLVLAEDSSVLTTIVERAGSELSCLKRSEVDELFDAFLSNPRVTSQLKVSMNSWHADYLWLHVKDLQGARKALAKSLELAPQNPSLRLKWAQLDFIGGESEAARKLLLELRGESFSPGERKTLNAVLASIEAGN